MAFETEEYNSIVRGSEIIAGDWLHLKHSDNVLIVTTENHLEEVQILKSCFSAITGNVDLMVLEDKGKHIGVFFDKNETVFDSYQTIVGATDYSLVTTKAVKRAIGSGSKYLSLPLSTNNGKSMLGFDFIQMDTKKSKWMANVIKKYVDQASIIDVRTEAGTDIRFCKRGRSAGFFNGDVRDGKGFSSASIEVYVPIEEDKTEGVAVFDGSLGYIGRIEEPFRVRFENGRIVDIEDTPDGRRLREYIESFNDSEMYVAAEFGIGLNTFSQCVGNCYIEDESAYGTYHIGFGRNIALGGHQEAGGHFDVVTLQPDIYADNRLIVEKGKIIVPEPQVY